jgi:MarR family transcriptional regulator, 2-MHQ and catechol-resistance regulon repressor
MPTHYKGTREERRALNAFINLMRASDSLASRLSERLEPHGLTPGQFGVLEALHHLGPMCQHALAEKLLRSGGNVTLVVDNLEKHGWVRRERQKSDRRMVVIHLTPAGERLIARVFPRHVKELVEEMSSLTAAEQESLRDILRKLGRAEKTPKKNDSVKEAHHVASSAE